MGAFKDREDRLYKMQYIQYEWVRYTLELFRRNKWFASGLLFWMYNDCWPAIGLSMVDYYSNPKAGYYGFQYAGKPVQPSICAEENGYGVYILNDSLKPVAGDLHLFIQNMRDKKPLWECTVPFSSPANQSCRNLVGRGTPAGKRCRSWWVKSLRLKGKNGQCISPNGSLI